MTTKDIRVLFLPGLESGPKGNKAVFLAEHFTTAVPDFGVSLRIIQKDVVLDPVTVAGVAVSVGVGFLGGSLAGVGTGIVLAWFLRSNVIHRVMTNIVSRNVREATRMLTSHRPDVVVGSSWGGGIAGVLLTTGAWRGPTVLMAPAYVIMRQRMGTYGEVGVENFKCDRLTVFHSPRDAVVPLAHSEALVEACTGPHADLVRIADDHRCNSVLVGGVTSTLYEAVVVSHC